MKACEMNRSVEGRMEQDSLTGHDAKSVEQKSDCDVPDAKNIWMVGKNVHDMQLLLHVITHSVYVLMKGGRAVRECGVLCIQIQVKIKKKRKMGYFGTEMDFSLL